MAYKALYRSYRPTKFNEVIGQEHVIKTLKNAIAENRTSHAYIFSGLRGIGKTTIARILAKAVNCENPVDGEPCNECASCKAINENTTSDIIEFDAASNNGVEEMRNILDKVNFLPAILKKKVYIIDEVHMLTNNAFNALLKTLEEPPTYIMFIMATTEPHKVPLTILSRCQRFDFKQLTLEELIFQVKEVAKKEKIDITDDAASAIAEVADGGMRDALSVLDQAATYAKDKITLDDINSITGNINNDSLINLVKAFNAKDAASALGICNDLLNNGKECSRMITCTIEFCRDLLLYKSLNSAPTSKNIFKNPDFIDLACSSSEANLFYYIDVLNDTQNKLRYTNAQKIYLEVGLMRIINETDKDIDFMARLKNLETALSNGVSVNGAPVDNYNQITALDAKIRKVANDVLNLSNKNNNDQTLQRIVNIEQALQNIQVPQSISNGEVDLSDVYKRIEEIEYNIAQIPTSSAPEVDLSSVEEKISALVNQMDSISNNSVTVDTFNKRIESLEGIINNLQNLVESSSTSETVGEPSPIVNTNQNVSNVNYEPQIKELHSILDSLAERVESIITSSPTKTSSFDDEKLEDVINRISTIETQVNELSNKPVISNNNGSIYNDKIDELRDEIALIHKVLVMKTTFEELEDKVESLSKDVEELKNQPKVIKQVVEDIQDVTEPQPIEEVIEESEPVVEVPTHTNPFDAPRNTVQPTFGSTTTDTTNVTNESSSVSPIVKRNNPYTSNAPSAIPANNGEEDITSKVYKVELLCDAMTEAFKPANREMKQAILNNWNSMTNKVGSQLATHAAFLVSGSLCCVGDTRLIIEYPTADLCNQIMHPDFYKHAKEVLQLTFNYSFDFLALPHDTLEEKKIEFKQTRQMTGSGYLTPFRNPALRVVLKKETTNNTISMGSFFGDNK